MESPKTILTPQALALFPLDELEALSVAAGWNQTPADWRRILALAPATCLGIAIDGHLAASSTAIVYGQHLAWIGMVLTLPQHRGHGLAQTLVQTLLARLTHIPTIQLDATEMGAPLYRKLGFRDDQPIERWAREGLPPTFQSKQPIGDSDALLTALAQDSQVWTLPDGSFAMLRPGREKSYLGPMIASSEAAADQLLSQLDPGCGLYWDLFPALASRLALNHGFRPLRRLTRMTLGAPRSTPLPYAIAGFEYG